MDVTIPAAVDSAVAVVLRPLVPRPDEAELCVRAEALRDRLAPHAGSERLDPYFLLAVGDLAGAIRCLEGLRSRGVAAEVAERALAPLADLVEACERAVADALPHLEAERRPRPARSRPSRGRRPDQAAGTS
jgi:hypothetical protein